MAFPQDIAEFEKLDLNLFYAQSNNKKYELVIVRGNDYETLEDAHKDGAAYHIINRLNWQETDGAIDGIFTTVECIDSNVKIVIYARITD